MRMQHKFARDHAFKPKLDVKRRLAWRHTSTIGDAENMSVNRHGVFPEGHVEHDIGGLASRAGQQLDPCPAVRNLAIKLRKQFFRERDDVSRLGAIEPDGLDKVADLLLPERQHLWLACRR